jgi:hypothetical protein
MPREVPQVLFAADKSYNSTVRGKNNRRNASGGQVFSYQACQLALENILPFPLLRRQKTEMTAENTFTRQTMKIKERRKETKSRITPGHAIHL